MLEGVKSGRGILKIKLIEYQFEMASHTRVRQRYPISSSLVLKVVNF